MKKTLRLGVGSAFKITPARAMVLSFFFLIVVGTILLQSPLFVADGYSTSLVDSLFLATSAVCVTGLSPLDISTHFTALGQVLLLILIQLGGLGIMLLTSSVLLFFGGRLGLRSRRTMQEQFQGLGMAGIMKLARYTVAFVFAVEFLGAIVLFIGWLPYFSPGEAAFHAIFHSISAFCCAGFSTFSDNLISFQDNILVNYTIMLEIVLGGLGFLVISELFGKRLVESDDVPVKLRLHISLHTKLVVVTTLALIFAGALVFGFFERDNPEVYHGASVITISLMQSVTCRTAGFCSVDMGRLHEETLQWMMFLMFVGGAPGGTAGGVKVTTFALLILAAWAQIRGSREVVVSGRKISQLRIMQAVALTVVAFLTVGVMTTILNYVEALPYDRLLFEIVSALGTVGLSVNLTPQLSDVSKVVLCFAMFLGRVGPLTFAASLVSSSKNVAIVDHAESEIVIG